MFSKSVRYRMRTLIYLAWHTSEDTFLKLDTITDALQISKPMMANVLQQMARQRVINSRKGRYGGFYMTEDQKSRSLMDVLQILGREDLRVDRCLLGLHDCDQKENCPFTHEVHMVQEGFHTLYQDKSIAELSNYIYTLHKTV